MADYRQDTACGKCGHAYTYFSHTGCPNCANLKKEASKAQFVENIMTIADNQSTEAALRQLATEVASLAYGR